MSMELEQEFQNLEIKINNGYSMEGFSTYIDGIKEKMDSNLQNEQEAVNRINSDFQNMRIGDNSEEVKNLDADFKKMGIKQIKKRRKGRCWPSNKKNVALNENKINSLFDVMDELKK